MEAVCCLAEEQHIVVVHPTTREPFKLPLDLSAINQQLYTQLLEAYVDLMRHEETLQKSHAMSELGNEMHRLQTENKELCMKAKRLEDALVRLEQFSGTLQRKLSHQTKSVSGPLIGMAGVVTLGTPSQLQVIKDLTRENVKLKQALAGIDHSQPQAVHQIMVISELQDLNTGLRLANAQLREELADMKSLGDGVENREQVAILTPYLDKVHQLELRIEVKVSLLNSLSEELEKSRQVLEEQLTMWNRKEEMFNRTVGNLRKMVDDMRQQMVAHAQMFRPASATHTNFLAMPGNMEHAHAEHGHVSLNTVTVSVQTDISMEELGKFEDEICSVEVEETERTIGNRHETGQKTVDDALDRQMNVGVGDILLAPEIHHDSECSSITGESSVRDSELTGISSIRRDSGISQLDRESEQSHSKEVVIPAIDSRVGEETADEKQKLMEECIFQLKEELSDLRLDKDTCEARLLQLNEIKEMLEHQNIRMLEDHHKEIAALRTEREQHQMNVSAVAAKADDANELGEDKTADEKQKLMEEQIFQLKEEVSDLRLDKDTCEARLLQLNEMKERLERQEMHMLEDHHKEIAVLQSERERHQVNVRGVVLEAENDDDKEMRREVEGERRLKQALQHRVDDLTRQVNEFAGLKQEVEMLRRDLKFEQQAHETTKEQIVSCKEMARTEMHKFRQQVEVERGRLSHQISQLTVAKQAVENHNRDLQLEANERIGLQRQLETENRERMQQVRSLQKEVMIKEDEVQRNRRVVEEARRQIREMKQERHLPSLTHGPERLSEVAHPPPDLLAVGVQSQKRKGSGDQPRQVIAQQPAATATSDYTYERSPRAQESHLYGSAGSVLVRSEYGPLQEWMKKEHVTSTVSGRTHHPSQQSSSSSPVRQAYSYSSQPSLMRSGTQFLYSSPEANQTGPLETRHPTVAPQQRPHKSPGDKVLECPRCQQNFSASDFSRYREHLEQCLT